MGTIKELADVAFRDYTTEGVPSSGMFEPPKVLVREIFDEIDEMVTVATTDHYVSFGPNMRYDGSGQAIEVDILAVRYDGFPKAAQVPGKRRVGTTINSTIDHVGSDEQSTIKVKYSDDFGGTWDGEQVVLGGAGLDCYTNSVGVGPDGVIHVIGRDRESLKKVHTTSRDWETWTPYEFLDLDNFSGYDELFTLEGFRFWGKMNPDPSGLGLYGGGYWTDGTTYQEYYVTSDLAGTNWEFSLINETTDPPAYNESAIFAPTATDRICISRRQGTATPTVFISSDSGTTWTELGAMDIPKSGGWLPQELHMETINGVEYLLLVMGNRRPSAAGAYDEPFPGPGVSIWFCEVGLALTSLTNWKMGHAHTWTFDSSNTTDSYCSMVTDWKTGTHLLFSYDQTSLTQARTFCWRADNILVGPRTPATRDPVFSSELGQAAYLDRRDIVGGTATVLGAAVKTITPNEHGACFVATSTNAINLPLAADVPPEFFVHVKARGATSSLVRAGSDTIDGGTSAITLTDGARAYKVRRVNSTSWELF